tara:strand:- start:112 stop:345 length:234 start_codon:yes stop_codon:yes gene_type:complete
MKLELAKLFAKDAKPLYIKQAKEWLRDLAGDFQEQEDIDDFLDNATDAMVLRKTDRLWDGGWVEFERTARLDEKNRK